MSKGQIVKLPNDGDWIGLRQAIQKISGLKLGPESNVVFGTISTVGGATFGSDIIVLGDATVSGLGTFSEVVADTGTITSFGCVSATISEANCDVAGASVLAFTSATGSTMAFTSSYVSSLECISATISELIADTATVSSLTADNITANNATISEIAANSIVFSEGTVSSFSITSAEISEANIDSATITSFSCISAAISAFSAVSGVILTEAVSVAYIDSIFADSATITALATISAIISELVVDSIGTGTALYQMPSTVGTSGQVIQDIDSAGTLGWTAQSGGSSGGYMGYIKITDTKNQNTSGGDFAKDTWQWRNLNTEDSDTNNDCALSSNHIVLTEGTYITKISCPAFYVDRHQTRLVNGTASSVILLGTNEYCNQTAGGHSVTRSFIAGSFTITANQYLRVEHRCQTSYATSGLGLANNWTSEIYTIAEFWRVS